MLLDNLIKLREYTDNLLGNGFTNVVVKHRIGLGNTYFEFEMDNEGNAIRVEELWKKAFNKLTVLRVNNKVSAG